MLVNGKVVRESVGKRSLRCEAALWDVTEFKGRIYVAETHRFSEGIEDDRNNLYWYLDDLAARKTADRRALHEKWKAKRSIEELTRKS